MFLFQVLQDVTREFRRSLTSCRATYFQGNTRFRESVPASTRLAVTLRYLASGESQQSLSWSFRLGRTTVPKIVRETCEVIWKVLSPIDGTRIETNQ